MNRHNLLSYPGVDSKAQVVTFFLMQEDKDLLGWKQNLPIDDVVKKLKSKNKVSVFHRIPIPSLDKPMKKMHK